MKSIIASLRSLTLPFGATSGPRIVLNGVLGRIEVYSNTGNLLLTIDDDGLQVYDATGMIRTRIAIPGLFATISFFSSSGNAAVLAAQAPGADYELWTIQGINGPKGFGRLMLLSPTNTTKNPLLQWDTGFYTSDVALPIVDLTGFTPGDAREAVVAVADIVQADNQGGANAPILGRSYPRGVIARGRRTTNLSFGAETQITPTTPASVTLISGRRYRFELSWRSIIWDTVTANVLCRLRIKDVASTVRMEWIDDITGGTARRGSTMSCTLDCPGEIAAGAHSFEATAERITGTLLLALEAAGTYPCTLTVEDVGDTSNLGT